MHVRNCGKLNPNYQHSKKAYVKGKKTKKIYDFHTLSTEIHKVFHKMWINIF